MGRRLGGSAVSDTACRKTCHYDAVPAVEVITAPIDWAGVVSAAAAGLAGIVGIAVTARQAARARGVASQDLTRTLEENRRLQQENNAGEDRRAMRAQKIRIYAGFQGAVDSVIAVAGRSKQQEGEFSEAHSAMVKAAAEVVLVAPPNIGVLAEKITRSVGDNIGPTGFRTNVDPQGTIDKNRKELTKEMKADLARYQTQPAPADSP
jgi:hypothetical protein